jgi:hypothetical protein
MVDHQYGPTYTPPGSQTASSRRRGKRRRSHGRRRQSRRAVHHGRVVKRTGDGSIIEFRSVVDAVRCAIEVQNRVIERNAGVPADRRGRIPCRDSRGRCDGRVNEIAAQTRKAGKRTILVSARQPAVSDHVGDQDRRQLPGLAHGTTRFGLARRSLSTAKANTPNAISLIGLGIAAFPCRTDRRRGDRECRPGVR